MAQIASAIEAAATAQRLLLPAADAVQLRTQVALALRRGEALGAAAAAAVAGWHKKALRRQVQQTVWNHASWRGHTLLCLDLPFQVQQTVWIYAVATMVRVLL